MLEDIQELHRRLLWQVRELAKDMSGEDIVDALVYVTEEVYSAGLDKAYYKCEFKNEDNISDAWDFVWITALALRLQRVRESRHVLAKTGQ